MKRAFAPPLFAAFMLAGAAQSAAGAGAQVTQPAAKQAQAMNYSVAWATQDGGGGRSTGGNYVLSGTIGQADADPLQPATGGSYQFDSGWWGGAAPIGPTNQVFSDGFE